MTRLRRAAAIVGVVVAGAALFACGGDDDEALTTRSGWQSKHGDLVAAFEKDLDAANDTISKGEKQATISACTQLSEDAKEMRSEVFPVANPAVDVPLRKAVDLAVQGADNCIQGGRSAAGADQVEAAQRELADAFNAFRDAKAAIDTWTS